MENQGGYKFGFRSGVRPNPKKDSGARRKRPTTPPYHVVQLKSKGNGICKQCVIRPRENSSSRCKKCNEENAQKK